MKKIVVLLAVVLSLVPVPTALAGFSDGGLHTNPINTY